MDFKQNLQGKVASVTGSSRGIGAAIALRLASHGADAVINYVASTAAVEKVAQQARQEHGVRAIAVQADVSNDADVACLFQETKKQLGRVDIVMVVLRHAIYAASKAAIIGLIKCVAWDLGPKIITVNCVAAGGVKSDMYVENSRKYLKDGDQLSWEELDARTAAWSPLGRVGMPDDVAGVVALLASSEAWWLTGQTVHVSGGPHMATA